MAVYEYCANGDLLTYLSKNESKKADIRFLQNIFTGVAKALVNIHSLGYVHCDIKPDNILLDASGTPKIADFGMCQPFSSRMIPQGTPSYLAPEVYTAWFQPSDHHRFTDKIDIFSLGAMAVKLVTDRYPFARTTAQMSKKDGMNLQQLKVHYSLSDRKFAEMELVSPKFARLVLLCLAYEAPERPSAEHLMQLIAS